MQTLSFLFAQLIVPYLPLKGSGMEWRQGEKWIQKGPQQRIATALSSVIIREILCASKKRRYYSISGKIAIFAL
jgi:hypothetical protein